MSQENQFPTPDEPTLPPSVDGMSDSAKQAWETTREKAGEAFHAGERYVRENPATSALSIFGLGFVLGLVVGWTIAHEEHQSYSRNARDFAKRWAW